MGDCTLQIFWSAQTRSVLTHVQWWSWPSVNRVNEAVKETRSYMHSQLLLFFFGCRLNTSCSRNPSAEFCINLHGRTWGCYPLNNKKRCVRITQGISNDHSYSVRFGT